LEHLSDGLERVLLGSVALENLVDLVDRDRRRQDLPGIGQQAGDAIGVRAAPKDLQPAR
jgi:hypothetical protein